MVSYFNVCSTTKNCENADKDTGACISCNTKFYLDVNDERKCKSNLEDDDLKYCSVFIDQCISCDFRYYLGEDNKCSNTPDCSKSELGICQECNENNFLTKDNVCTPFEHCIHSGGSSTFCKECEDGYYFDNKELKCLESEGIFKNCKYSNYLGTICEVCKDGYYVDEGKGECHPNNEEGPLYQCVSVSEDGKKCNKCSDGFYLEKIGNKCGKIFYCELSEGDKCIKCEESFCNDMKKGTCEFNEWVEEEENKVYFMCNRTNEEGNKCDQCLENFEIGENGLCVDIVNCKEKDEDGKCIKCNEKEYSDSSFSFCINKDYGCVETFSNDHCLRCDGIDFGNCTTCEEGYELTKSQYDGYVICQKIE